MTDATDSERSPLEQLHDAIQRFSNHLADSEDEVGMVTSAIVVWDEVSFGEDGNTQRATIYAATGDRSTPNSSLGLAVNLLRTLERDIVGCRRHDDD